MPWFWYDSINTIGNFDLIEAVVDAWAVFSSSFSGND
jgi:hypothetical protein